MTDIVELRDFRERKIKAKQIFFIKEIDKVSAYNFVRQYHYLGGAKFFCIYAFGLYYKSIDGAVCVGVATYSNPQGTSTLKGWFGFDNQNQEVLELSRLCMLPSLNGTNATSFLLGNSMKMLRKYHVRAIITLADASRHIGSIYQVCNFKYYGLSDKKQSFYAEDGKVDPRGMTRTQRGVWVDRTRKHRYCYLLDKNLRVLYKEQPHPKSKLTIRLNCCSGIRKVYDARFNTWYTCPICCGYIQRIDGSGHKVNIQHNKKYNKNEEELNLF